MEDQCGGGCGGQLWRTWPSAQVEDKVDYGCAGLQGQ